MKIELHTKNNLITINKILYFNYGGYDTVVYYEVHGDEEKHVLFEGILNLNEIIIRLENLFRKEEE